VTDDRDDPLDELLRRANPVEETRLALPAEHAGAQLLYEKITGTPYGGQGVRRRRLGGLMAAIAALAALGGGAAYASLGPHHATERLVVLCYSQARLGTRAAAVSAGVDGPVASCAGAWAAGEVGSGPVPLLVACVATTGVAAVFPSAPGADVCRQLGLAALPASGPTPNETPPTAGPPTTDPLVAMRQAVTQSLGSGCFGSTAAKSTVEQILANIGLHWTVVVPEPFPASRPCASPAFDEIRQQVVLVGIPPTGLPRPPTP